MSDKEFLYKVKDLRKQDRKLGFCDVRRLVEIIERHEQKKQAFIEWLEDADVGRMGIINLRDVINKAKDML